MGSAPTQIAFGRSAENKGDHQAARNWFAKAAQTGSVEALRLLATNLLVREPLAINDGIGMAREAASRGDSEAAHLCATLAANDSGLPNRWNIALDYLLQAARSGHSLARQELSLLSGKSGMDWAQMRGTADMSPWLQTRPGHTLSASPDIRAFEGFLPEKLCDWIVERAKTRLEPAKVNMPDSGAGARMENMRTNSHAGFNLAECDIILMLTRARIAAVSGLSPQGLEWPMALNYKPGEEYKPHYDFFDTNARGLAQDVQRFGQRVATFLIYLNDDFDGGETDFPKLDIRYRGKKGDALLFFNVEDGKPDARTLHAGLAPTRGEKWLYSQWIREPKI
ncbi:MAG: 2OG-Fe(II) oxygenase [Rhizomicrobium sp.]